MLKPLQCPVCKSKDVRTRLGDKTMVCRRCGHSWKRASKKGAKNK